LSTLSITRLKYLKKGTVKNATRSGGGNLNAESLPKIKKNVKGLEHASRNGVLCLEQGAPDLPPSTGTHVAGIDRVVHDGDPALEGGRLEEADVGGADSVKVDGRVDPLGVVLCQAGAHIRHHLVAQALLCVHVLALIDGARVVHGGEMVGLNIRALVDGARAVQGGKIVGLKYPRTNRWCTGSTGCENCQIKYPGTNRWRAGSTGCENCQIIYPGTNNGAQIVLC
jgi:hypothetical protein